MTPLTWAIPATAPTQRNKLFAKAKIVIASWWTDLLPAPSASWRLAEIFGYLVEEFLALESIYEIVAPSDRQRFCG